MKKFRTKYEIISSSIRRLAVEKGKDRICAFFIPATLRWTPSSQGLYNSCTLCDLEEKDNFDHIFRCNSLKSYHKNTNSMSQNFFATWNVKIPILPNTIHWIAEQVLRGLTITTVIKNISRIQITLLIRRHIANKWPTPPDLKEIKE